MYEETTSNHGYKLQCTLGMFVCSRLCVCVCARVHVRVLTVYVLVRMHPSVSLCQSF